MELSLYITKCFNYKIIYSHRCARQGRETPLYPSSYRIVKVQVNYKLRMINKLSRKRKRDWQRFNSNRYKLKKYIVHNISPFLTYHFPLLLNHQTFPHLTKTHCNKPSTSSPQTSNKSYASSTNGFVNFSVNPLQSINTNKSATTFNNKSHTYQKTIIYYH